jgi:hypothetical protein
MHLIFRATPWGRAAFLPLCLLPGLAAAAAAGDSYLSYSGTASARNSATFLYGERHVLHYHEGRLAERVVLYTCSDGTAFARKSVSYLDPLAPDFVLDDAANGLHEGIRTAGGRRTVFFQASPKEPEKSGPLPQAPDLVADAGFDEFVRANWQRLLTDKPLQIRFLVPSRLKDYAFQAQRQRSETIDGTRVEVFRLRLSGIWGWFLSGIDVYYSDAEHVLLRYDGLSDLRDADGDNFKTQIEFPLAERRPSSEQAMRDARQAAVRPCR